MGFGTITVIISILIWAVIIVKKLYIKYLDKKLLEQMRNRKVHTKFSEIHCMKRNHL